MRLGADVLIKLKWLRSQCRRQRTPEGAGNLHGGPCLPRPLQGSIWGERMLERGKSAGMQNCTGKAKRQQ